MEVFPEITGKQVVIMRADSLTGHVLDVDFKLAVEDSQKVFTIANSFSDAIAQVEVLKQQGTNVEFVIYGEGKKVLKFIA